MYIYTCTCTSLPNNLSVLIPLIASMGVQSHDLFEDEDNDDDGDQEEKEARVTVAVQLE